MLDKLIAAIKERNAPFRRVYLSPKDVGALFEELALAGVATKREQCVPGTRVPAPNFASIGIHSDPELASGEFRFEDSGGISVDELREIASRVQSFL